MFVVRNDLSKHFRSNDCDCENIFRIMILPIICYFSFEFCFVFSYACNFAMFNQKSLIPRVHDFPRICNFQEQVINVAQKYYSSSIRMLYKKKNLSCIKTEGTTVYILNAHVRNAWASNTKSSFFQHYRVKSNRQKCTCNFLSLLSTKYMII